MSTVVRRVAAVFAAICLAIGGGRVPSALEPQVALATGPGSAFIIDTVSGTGGDVVRAFRQPGDATVSASWNAASLTVYATPTSGTFLNYTLNAGAGTGIGVGTTEITWNGGACTETLDVASISPTLESGVSAEVVEMSATFHRTCGTEETYGIIRIANTDPYAILGNGDTPSAGWTLAMTGAGATFVGRTSPTATATLTNLGTGSVTFGTPVFDGSSAAAWTLTGNTCTGALAGGASCEISATAVGWVPGTYNEDYVTVPVTGVARGSVRIYTPSNFLAAEYVPLDPVRVVDTRKAQGATLLKTGIAQTVHLTDLNVGNARINIPPDAVGITGNLTVVKPTTAGWASLTTTPAANPSVKTLYAPAVGIVGNAVNLRIAEDGTVGLTWNGAAGSSTHALLDITGYWRAVSPVSGSRSGNFHAYRPTRIVDNKAGKGFVGHLYAGKPKVFTVPLDGVDWENTAVTGVVTVVKPPQGGSIYLGPAVVAAPTTTAMNFKAGDSRANGFFARLNEPATYGSPKKLTITYVGAPGTYVDVYVDLSGVLGRYNGFGYVPLVPNRIVDSAVKKGIAGPLKAGVHALVNVANRAPADASRNVPPDSYTDAMLAKYGITGNLWMVRPSAAGVLSSNPSGMYPASRTTVIRSPALDRRACTVLVPWAGSLPIGLDLYYAAPAGSATGVWFDVTGYFIY